MGKTATGGWATTFVESARCRKVKGCTEDMGKDRCTPWARCTEDMHFKDMGKDRCHHFDDSSSPC